MIGNCTYGDCDKQGVRIIKGFCPMHYARLLRHGDASVAKRDMARRLPAGLSPPERIARKGIPQPNGCIRWDGFLTRGYGRINISGRSKLAHHAAWELVNGPVPEGLTLDHLCHNADPVCREGDDCPHRACINLDHLGLATPTENVLRGKSAWADNARKTRCPKGHPLSGANLFVEPSTGRRRCLICKRAISRANKLRNGRRRPDDVIEAERRAAAWRRGTVVAMAEHGVGQKDIAVAIGTTVPGVKQILRRHRRGAGTLWAPLPPTV
jgi:HNH endonuclease